MLLVEEPQIEPLRIETPEHKVFCVIEHAYQNLGVAEAVCNGKFDIAGSTISLGTPIDWLTNPLPCDIEWQIEWHKFYYGLDLAYAFSKTGEERFVLAWERLVSSFIRQVPLDLLSSDVLARRTQNWIYAKQIFTNSEGFTGFSSGFEKELRSSIGKQVEYLFNNLTPERNHRTLELYALFIIALAMPDLDDGDEILRFAMRELTENLLTDFRADGVHREQSTHYHCTVLRSFLGARENARRFGLKFSPKFDDRLTKACEFAMHFHRPDGMIPAMSDADTGSYLDLLQVAGEIYSRDDFLFVATRGVRGEKPKDRNIGFPDGGYFIQRSRWGDEDARFLMFDCGPIGDGGHGHYDLLNIEIATAGRPLIVDGGRYTYAEDPGYNWRHYFKGTAAHNTVMVDGKDQTTYRSGKPKDTARSEFIEQLNLPNVDILSGRVISPNYDAVHTRRIFFIRDEYWLVFDHLKAHIPHRYDLRYHLTPELLNRCDIVSREGNKMVQTPNVTLVFENHVEPSIETGWFSPQYGIKHPAPCISVVSEGEAEAEFYTLIVPSNINDFATRFEVMKSFAGTNVDINRNGRTEGLRWEIRDERLVNVECE